MAELNVNVIFDAHARHVICILSLVTVTAVAHRGPAYAIYCLYQADCPVGQTCFKDYLGCDVGQCACTHGTKHDGSCILKPSGGKCSSHDECAKGTRCLEGRCVCPGEMIDGDTYCLKDHERLLGDHCTPNHICVHKQEDSWEYVQDKAQCTDGKCVCRLGLVRDGDICRRIRPNEAGCWRNVDCSGDSVCRDGYCLCPDGYRVVTGHKCGTIYARTNIRETFVCDEMIYKDRLCAEGLQCVSCGSDNYRCRKYRSRRPKPPRYSAMKLSSGPLKTSGSATTTMPSLMFSQVTLLAHVMYFIS